MNSDASSSTISYEFLGISECNMCCAPIERSVVMGKRLNQSQGIRPTRKVGITTTIMRCRDCGLVFPNPLPVPKNMSQHYGMVPESYWNPSYFVADDAYFRGHIEKFFKQQTKHDGTLHALDIGAGVGKCMNALTRHGFEAYGMEPSEQFHRRAVETMRIPEDRISNNSVEEASYSDNMFDFVTFGAVLEHLYDPSAAILKALRWAKPGGLVHIEVPSSAWLTNKVANMVYALQGLDYVANISPMHVPYHLYEFGSGSFLRHAEMNQYTVASMELLETRTYLPDFLNPVVQPLMRATKSGMQMEVWLRKPARQ